jgi:hypothetical protein
MRPAGWSPFASAPANKVFQNMEGLAYGFISLFWLVEIIGLFVSLCAILFGAIWLISKGGKPGCATRWPMGCPIVALVLGSLVFVTLGYCAVTWVYNDYLDARATCLELPLAESYKLGIFQRGNKMTGFVIPSRGDYYNVDDHYIGGITEYSIEDHIMLGRTTTGWFWFDLITTESEYISDQAEYLATLRRLGFADEPALLPIQDRCQIQGCRPCPTPTPHR